MTDHSQWGEQGIIHEFFKNTPVGRFLDLGAYDGMEGSNTRGLSDIGWSGVCVEANPFVFKRLVENYRNNPGVKCVNAAVYPRNTVVLFNHHDGQLGTVVARHNVEKYITAHYYVGAISPRVLYDVFWGPSFDFVSFDIEGIDVEVIESSAELLEDTRLICVEDGMPNNGFDLPYYTTVINACADLGFTEVVGRTTIEGRWGNTLLARQ